MSIQVTQAMREEWDAEIRRQRTANFKVWREQYDKLEAEVSESIEQRSAEHDEYMEALRERRGKLSLERSLICMAIAGRGNLAALWSSLVGTEARKNQRIQAIAEEEKLLDEEEERSIVSISSASNPERASILAELGKRLREQDSEEWVAAQVREKEAQYIQRMEALAGFAATKQRRQEFPIGDDDSQNQQIRGGASFSDDGENEIRPQFKEPKTQEQLNAERRDARLRAFVETKRRKDSARERGGYELEM